MSSAMFSYSKACATIEHITEADVPVLEALDQEELAWLLRVSARFDHMTAAKGLLAARASVNHITPHHSAGAYNALHEACRYNANVDMLLLMLQARGDPDVKTRCKNNPRTALQIAEGEGHASLAPVASTTRTCGGCFFYPQAHAIPSAGDRLETSDLQLHTSSLLTGACRGGRLLCVDGFGL